MNVYAVKKINISKIKNINEYWLIVNNTPVHYCNGIKELREYCGGQLKRFNYRAGYGGINGNIEYLAERIK